MSSCLTLFNGNRLHKSELFPLYKQNNIYTMNITYKQYFAILDKVYKAKSTEYLAKINALINDIANEQENIQRINNNCFIIRFSTLQRTNIFDVTFHDWKEQARQLQKLIEKRPMTEIITFIESIYSTKDKKIDICRYGCKNDCICFNALFIQRILERIELI